MIQFDNLVILYWYLYDTYHTYCSATVQYVQYDDTVYECMILYIVLQYSTIKSLVQLGSRLRATGCDFF
jgi:hypothetical protein